MLVSIFKRFRKINNCTQFYLIFLEGIHQAPDGLKIAESQSLYTTMQNTNQCFLMIYEK